ncbi:MAG: hypothetical protein JSS65_01555 [Armatimonadetes bacterium]|nr:hypothetical protein [Armatimonadota bacterium]
MNWTVDYGQGPHAVSVPHVFWDDRIDIRWEGPATYRTSVQARAQEWLVFEGVSYEAVVSFNGHHVLTHRGIWDAFSIDLSPWTGQSVDVEVKVTKNGGATFPVKDVLSGFLPYVDSTFGGLYRPVRVVESATDPLEPEPKPKQRIGVQGTKLWLDNRPWFMRGVLTWGWYPDYRHPAPPLAFFEEEWKRVKELGFNTVKFCLWLPPHEAIEALKKRDLVAWVELPLWMPTGDEQRLSEMEEEIKRIVLQYRHHDNIVCWTVGCELSESTPPEFRQRLTEFVLEESGCPLVKDNSGGAEMYGGDPREFGTFDDFHPYCDLMYYPQVLQSLAHGPREKRPILLGEFNDFDHVRDLDALAREMPYWASNDPALNEQGVRWQYDFPPMLEAREGVRWPQTDWSYTGVAEMDELKSEFIRKRVMESVAAIEDVAGWVVTGLDDTPISTSGVKRGPRAMWKPRHPYNRSNQFFVVPRRCPPWVRGGNRPGWSSQDNFFSGLVQLTVGVRSEAGGQATYRRFLGSFDQETDLDETFTLNPPAGVPVVAFRIEQAMKAGRHGLSLFDQSDQDVEWTWFFQVFDRLTANDLQGYRIEPRDGHPLAELPWDTEGELVTVGDEDHAEAAVSFGVQSAAMPAPFWRECIQMTADPGDEIGDWSLLHDVASDYVLPPDDEVLLRRIDTRTYKEGSYITRRPNGQIVTTLRPWGGLGIQPPNIQNNPAGHWLIRRLIELHRNSTS